MVLSATCAYSRRRFFLMFRYSLFFFFSSFLLALLTRFILFLLWSLVCCFDEAYKLHSCPFYRFCWHFVSKPDKVKRIQKFPMMFLKISVFFRNEHFTYTLTNFVSFKLTRWKDCPILFVRSCFFARRALLRLCPCDSGGFPDYILKVMSR